MRNSKTHSTKALISFCQTLRRFIVIWLMHVLSVFACELLPLSVVMFSAHFEKAPNWERNPPLINIRRSSSMLPSNRLCVMLRLQHNIEQNRAMNRIEQIYYDNAITVVHLLCVTWRAPSWRRRRPRCVRSLNLLCVKRCEIMAHCVHTHTCTTVLYEH
jgi:hypothetical protein